MASIIENDPTKAVNKALNSEFRLSMTSTETLSVLAEKVDDSEIQLYLKDLSSTVEKINDLKAKVQKDMTRTPAEKIRLLDTKSKPLLKSVQDSIDKVAKVALKKLQDTQKQLFTSNTALNATDMSMLPMVAKALSEDSSNISIDTVTENEGKLLVHVMKSYPSIVNREQFDPDKDMSYILNGLNERFTPEAHTATQAYRAMHDEMTNLVKSAKTAQESILPSNLLEQINKGRVA